MNLFDKYNCILCKYNKYNKNGDNCYNHREKDEYGYFVDKCKSLSNIYYGTIVNFFLFKQIDDLLTKRAWRKAEKYNKNAEASQCKKSAGRCHHKAYSRHISVAATVPPRRTSNSQKSTGFKQRYGCSIVFGHFGENPRYAQGSAAIVRNPAQGFTCDSLPTIRGRYHNPDHRAGIAHIPARAPFSPAKSIIIRRCPSFNGLAS